MPVRSFLGVSGRWGVNIMNWTEVLGMAELADPPVPLLLGDEEWRGVARQLGITHVPMSYIDYFRAFGLGYWGDEMAVLSPVPSSAGDTVVSFFQQEWPQYSGREYCHLIPTVLLPGEVYLCWTPSEQNDAGEYALQIVDPGFARSQFIGYGLNEFFGTWWLGGKINTLGLLEGDWQTDLPFVPSNSER